MSRPSTFLTFYDEASTISIKNLKEWGYLEPNQIISGTITWSINDRVVDSIKITVNTYKDYPHIELSYVYKGSYINYKVILVSVCSNLGIGSVWYFICPSTSKRCRKLYSVGEWFLHRHAFKNCLYKKQSYSQKKRELNKLLEALNYKTVYKQLNSRNFKSHYAGKPTKRYLQILKKVKGAKGVSLENFRKHIYQ